MRHFLANLFSGPAPAESKVPYINERRSALAAANNDELKRIAGETDDLCDIIAVTALLAERILGLRMFDVQLQCALALASATEEQRGKIAEMQTGEGKTLAAVPAIAWYARSHAGVHVMTVNDYLARRDASWMGPIYEALGLTTGYIQQGMTAAERRRAYACDITYSTANEIGFDYLRDGLALSAGEQVHRPFAAAMIDEADSILIDEARIPLVIAGGNASEEPLAYRIARIVRVFQPWFHYTLDEYGRNVSLTDGGIRVIEDTLDCGNLFDAENLPLLTAVQDALHAHALLRRDVDYIVKNGAIESIDEFKGRIALDRRWPAGLHSAVEAKEGLALKQQGRILGSITLQNLIALYPAVSGMTGTAATQAEEFRKIYGLEVEAIPTNRPVIRVDHPDVVFRTKHDKEVAVIEEITRTHATGQPVLVGTASVEESERLSQKLHGIPHEILNARNDEREAAIVARAGERGAVTISTNMAGRGTDIKLGEGVAELGGLYVIGTNKHESRRIDNQLRGRSGRQGDPGESRFFISYEDDLLVRYGIRNERLGHDPDSIQRLVEGQNLDIRQFLNKYESTTEGQRLAIRERRQEILCDAEMPERDRLVALNTIDELWCEFLAAVTDLRSGIHWVSWGGRDPLHEYLVQVDELFQQLEMRIDEEMPKRIAEAGAPGSEPVERGATWTYLTTDQPFGAWNERILRGLIRITARRS